MIGILHAVAVDAPDIAGLAAFYNQLAGWKTTSTEDDWITMNTDDGWQIGLQEAPDHLPPRWPDAAHPQQAHFDLRVPDLEAASSRAVELGASLLRKNESWYTLSDPAGHPFDLCLAAEQSGTTLMGVMLDAPDTKTLSHFYAELLGKPISYEGDGMAMIGQDGDQPLLFQQVEAYTPPRWPDPAYPQQFHLDVKVDDIESAERAVLALGGTRLPDPDGDWRVYADPAGKPFCLV